MERRSFLKAFASLPLVTITGTLSFKEKPSVGNDIPIVMSLIDQDGLHVTTEDSDLEMVFTRPDGCIFVKEAKALDPIKYPGMIKAELTARETSMSGRYMVQSRLKSNRINCASNIMVFELGDY